MAPAPKSTQWSRSIGGARGTWKWFAPGENTPTGFSDGQLAYLLHEVTVECETSRARIATLTDKNEYLETELAHTNTDVSDLQKELLARDDLIDTLGDPVPIFGPILSWERVMDSGPHGPLLRLKNWAARLRRRPTRSFLSALTAALTAGVGWNRYVSNQRLLNQQLVDKLRDTKMLLETVTEQAVSQGVLPVGITRNEAMTTRDDQIVILGVSVQKLQAELHLERIKSANALSTIEDLNTPEILITSAAPHETREVLHEQCLRIAGELSRSHARVMGLEQARSLDLMGMEALSRHNCEAQEEPKRLR